MTKHGITMIATAMAMAAAAKAEPAHRPAADGTAPMEEEQPAAMPPARLYKPDTGEVPVSSGRWVPPSKVGVSVMGGGGVTNYTKSAISDATSVGGSWGFRFTVATRRWVAFDASYIGASNLINDSLGLTVNNNTIRLNRNGIEGALRINAPLYAGNTLLSPYVLGGAGWNAYKVTNFSTVTADSGISGSPDNTLSVPLGIGFAVGYKGFMGDVRGTFRPTYFQSILINQGGSTLTNWDASAMVGYEF